MHLLSVHKCHKRNKAEHQTLCGKCCSALPTSPFRTEAHRKVPMRNALCWKELSCLCNTLIGGSSHPTPERPGPLASTGDKARESFQHHMDQLEPLSKLDHSSFSVCPFLLLSFSLPGMFQRAVLGTVICLTSVSWGTCLRLWILRMVLIYW